MNRVGIMVDISHVSDSAFYDVIKDHESATHCFSFIVQIFYTRISTQHVRRHDKGIGKEWWCDPNKLWCFIPGLL